MMDYGRGIESLPPPNIGHLEMIKQRVLQYRAVLSDVFADAEIQQLDIHDVDRELGIRCEEFVLIACHKTECLLDQIEQPVLQEEIPPQPDESIVLPKSFSKPEHYPSVLHNCALTDKPNEYDPALSKASDTYATVLGASKAASSNKILTVFQHVLVNTPLRPWKPQMLLESASRNTMNTVAQNTWVAMLRAADKAPNNELLVVSHIFVTHVLEAFLHQQNIPYPKQTEIQTVNKILGTLNHMDINAPGNLLPDSQTYQWVIWDPEGSLMQGLQVYTQHKHYATDLAPYVWGTLLASTAQAD